MDNIFLTKLLSTFPHLKYSHIIFIIIIHWKRTHFSIYFIKAETTHISLKSTRSIKNITIINNVLFASFFSQSVSNKQLNFMPRTHLKTKVVILKDKYFSDFIHDIFSFLDNTYLQYNHFIFKMVICRLFYS